MFPSHSKTIGIRDTFDPRPWAQSLDTLTWLYLQLCSIPRESTVKLDSGTAASDLAEECWEASIFLSDLPEARELEGRGLFWRKQHVAALLQGLLYIQGHGRPMGCSSPGAGPWKDHSKLHLLQRFKLCVGRNEFRLHCQRRKKACFFMPVGCRINGFSRTHKYTCRGSEVLGSGAASVTALTLSLLARSVTW